MKRIPLISLSWLTCISVGLAGSLECPAPETETTPIRTIEKDGWVLMRGWHGWKPEEKP